LLIQSIYKLLTASALLLLFSIHSYALKLTVTPEDVAPGDIVFLIMNDVDGENAEADFLGQKIHFAQTIDGDLMAFVPIDINTEPATHKLNITIGDEQHTAFVRVIPKEFTTIKLTLPEGKVTLSPENQKRATNEALLLKEIWPVNTGKLWTGNFMKPLPTEVSTEFGVKRIMNEKKTSVHRGMDFRGKEGTPVKALNSGTVVFNKDLFYGGNTLIVDHGMGLYSVYMHLSKFTASKGEKVTKGQTVGLVGMSGRATGPHLHLSVKLQGVSVNPDSLFKLEL
jgi:murein DD-endopeptidase MepM/ murein hydrolase activator NlpD